MATLFFRLLFNEIKVVFIPLQNADFNSLNNYQESHSW